MVDEKIQSELNEKQRELYDGMDYFIKFKTIQWRAGVSEDDKEKYLMLQSSFQHMAKLCGEIAAKLPYKT